MMMIKQMIACARCVRTIWTCFQGIGAIPSDEQTRRESGAMASQRQITDSARLVAMDAFAEFTNAARQVPSPSASGPQGEADLVPTPIGNSVSCVFHACRSHDLVTAVMPHPGNGNPGAPTNNNGANAAS
jgi:hypothetical protein